MKRKKAWKTAVIVALVLALLGGAGFGGWYYFTQVRRSPVSVYAFADVGMTEYWGDARESYGPVSTDGIQTVYLSDTQTVTEVFVQAGDTVHKGDVLFTFDTTLTQLSLERARLAVEKLKLQLEDAQDRLMEIRGMVPMYIPPEPEPTEPTEPDLGAPLKEDAWIASPDSFDGSAPELALVCWLKGDTAIDEALLQTLWDRARELQEKTWTPPEPADPTDPSPEGTEPPAGTAPPTEMPEVERFFVIFKATEGDMTLGQTLTWQGLCVTRRDDGRFTFRFFDASFIPDPTVELPEPEEPELPDIQINSGYTAAQIAQMRAEQEKTIKDLEFQIKMSETEYKIMQTEASDGKVYAQIDGAVVSVSTPEDAQMYGEPFMKLSAGGGFTVTGTVNELDRDLLQIGQEVTVNDWYSGMTYTGTIQSVGDYPESDEYGYYAGVPNVSYYPFTVFVEGEADLMEGSYANIQYAAQDQDSRGIYLSNPFIREEGGRSYVFVRGADGLLEKRYVTVGRSLWGSYMEILSGLTAEDYVAFPYGKDVKEGAPAVDGDLSDLYGGYY